jgi:hypothetical protein
MNMPMLPFFAPELWKSVLITRGVCQSSQVFDKTLRLRPSHRSQKFPKEFFLIFR